MWIKTLRNIFSYILHHLRMKRLRVVDRSRENKSNDCTKDVTRFYPASSISGKDN